MLPGTMVSLETFLLGVDSGIFPAKYHSILSHRTDLDTDTAG
jgi:hypothetical protein